MAQEPQHQVDGTASTRARAGRAAHPTVVGDLFPDCPGCCIRRRPPESRVRVRRPVPRTPTMPAVLLARQYLVLPMVTARRLKPAVSGVLCRHGHGASVAWLAAVPAASGSTFGADSGLQAGANQQLGQRRVPQYVPHQCTASARSDATAPTLPARGAAKVTWRGRRAWACACRRPRGGRATSNAAPAGRGSGGVRDDGRRCRRR